MVKQTIDIPENARDVKVEQSDDEVAVSYETVERPIIVLESGTGPEKHIDPSMDFDIIDTGNSGGDGRWEFCADEHQVAGGSVSSTLNSGCSYSDEWEYGWYFETMRIEAASDVL